MASHSVPDLIENTRVAIQKALKVARVDFLLMDREFIANYRDKNGQT